MQDEPIEPTVQVMREALDGRVVHRECPFCGPNEWFSDEDRVWLLFPFIRQSGEWVPTGEHDPAIGFICKGCGFVRLHMAAIPPQGGQSSS